MLDPPVESGRDHILGPPVAQMTLIEYGSYACPYCHAAHEVIAGLRDRFGDRMRYVFRHLPIRGALGLRSAQMAEYAGLTTGQFWEVHDALMKRGPDFGPGEIDAVAAEFGLPAPEQAPSPWREAAARVDEDARSARRSGAKVTPTFFINNRRYEGAWDETALAEAMLGSLGHRLHAATLDFVRWAPSTGLLLLLMSVLAVALTNSPLGATFASWWRMSFALRLDDHAFSLPILDWINHALLTVFFLVVGLEIKRELTVGRLSSPRAAAFPIVAAAGGMIVPAIIYLSLAPASFAAGWGMTITTDTAFAVALIILLGDRVPVDLRVFLTAAVIADDLVAIAIVGLFYSDAISIEYLIVSAAVAAMMVTLNRWSIYSPLPYGLLGVALWICLHHAGLHPTLAGVILAAVTPTRPPANLKALIAQAQTVIDAEVRRTAEAVMHHGPSEPALRAMDAIHDRLESPANKLLRTVEPWSSYVVLPVFALANAGVVLSEAVVESHTQLVLAIVLGLIVGKPLGIVAAAWCVSRIGLLAKPDTYTWRQLAGAGALAGIGFTMSLFIASEAFPSADDFAAAKVAIFLASLIAGTLGVAILWWRTDVDEASGRSA